MIKEMGAGVVGRLLAWGVGGMGALLTDAWHLDDLHLLRPECRRTDLSPNKFILEEREVGLATNMCKEESWLTVLLRLVKVAV